MDADRVSAVSIVTPNAKLREGLVVVDTPGIGGVHRGHTAVTLGVLPQADVVLYVTDAGQSLLSSEIAFIADAARAVDAGSSPERLLFAVTKTDQVPDAAIKVGDVRDRVAAIPGLDDRCAVLPVSSRQRLLYLADGDPEDQELSGFTAFEERLEASLGQARLRLRLALPLAELDAVVGSLLVPVTEALTVLGARDTEARTALVAGLASRRDQSAKLAEGAGSWPGELQAALSAASSALKDKATAELAALWREFRVAYSTDQVLLEDPQLALDELAGKLALMVGQLAAQAATLTSAACDDVAERSGLRPHGPRIGSLPMPAMPEPVGMRLVGTASGVVDNLATAFEAAVRGAQVGAQYGSKIGQVAWGQALQGSLPGAKAILISARVIDQASGGSVHDQILSPGAAAGRAAGAVVGATLAFAGQVRATRDISRADRVAVLDQLYGPWEKEQRDYLHAAINDIVSAYAHAAEADLRDRIDEQRAQCDAALAQIGVLLHAQERETAGTRDELDARRDTLLELRRSLADLASDVQAVAGSAR